MVYYSGKGFGKLVYIPTVDIDVLPLSLAPCRNLAYGEVSLPVPVGACVDVVQARATGYTLAIFCFRHRIQVLLEPGAESNRQAVVVRTGFLYPFIHGSPESAPHSLTAGDADTIIT